jgi:uncharacterized membrane protein YhaH (DUF805 family)
MEWYLVVLRKYATFTGRAQRAEYWYFALYNFLASLVLGIVDAITGTASNSSGLGLLGGLYALAVFIPSLAVLFRRLHDTGHSAWWIFIALIPVVGVIVLLVFVTRDSEPGENRFGPNPKATLG